MAKPTLLQQLIHERDELDAAIRVIQRLSGGLAERVAAKHAAKALGKRTYTRRNGGPPPARAEADIVTASEDLKESIGNLEFPEALVLAVRSAGVAISTAELTELLQQAGVMIPHGKQPVRRYVGVMAGNLTRGKRLKKTAHGWTIGARA